MGNSLGTKKQQKQNIRKKLKYLCETIARMTWLYYFTKPDITETVTRFLAVIIWYEVILFKALFKVTNSMITTDENTGKL